MTVNNLKEQIDSWLDYGQSIWFINNKTKEPIAYLYNKQEWYNEVFCKFGECNIYHKSFHPLCNDINLYIETSCMRSDTDDT